MSNPWEEISLSDYENHMRLDSVLQLQTLNQMMKGQLHARSAGSVMILGIAGGNGLEHIESGQFRKIYGIDLNEAYLRAVQERYGGRLAELECLRVDLLKEADRLPRAELLVANLLIEYIGYDCFQRAVAQVEPRFVSCVIQINLEDGWVSDSPYLHAFDGLDQVHHQIEEGPLIQTMQAVGYRLLAKEERPLPNGKKLVQLDFER